MTLKPLSALALLTLLAAMPARPQTDSSRVVDSLTSGGAFRGTALRRLPIDDPRQAFTLIPGVVLRNGDIRDQRARARRERDCRRLAHDGGGSGRHR